VPDLTFILDLDPASATARYTPTDRFEHQAYDFHQRLREGFLHIAVEPRHHIIDTSLPKEAVFETVRQAVAARL